MTKVTRQWLRKAEADYLAAKKLALGLPALPDQVCFNCQQCAENLKALLQEAGSPVPRTHDLADLLDLVLPIHPSLRSLRRGMDFLTRFAVETRYPGDQATKRQAAASLRWMERIRTACGAILF